MMKNLTTNRIYNDTYILSREFRRDIDRLVFALWNGQRTRGRTLDKLDGRWQQVVECVYVPCRTKRERILRGILRAC